MHDGSHDTVSLAVLDHLIILSTRSLILFLHLLLLLITMIIIVVQVTSREGSHQEKLAVDFLALGDDEGLSLFLDFFTQLFDELLKQKLLYQGGDDVLSHPVPQIFLALRILHIQWNELLFETVELFLINCDIDSDKTSFLTLNHVQVEVILVSQRAKWQLSDTFNSVTRMEQV